MTLNAINDPSQLAEEIILSWHHPERRSRRMIERNEWIATPKLPKQEKKLTLFGEEHVDHELYPALQVINQLGITTEYSCAGVSIQDEPEDHSLYAYVTLYESVEANQFVKYIQDKLKHRVIITYEPSRKRYDISSYFIQHNRSFCHYLFLVSREYKLIRSELSKA